MQDDHHESIDLYDAILQLSDKEEVMNFLLDLCTPQEIEAMTERWKVCQLLNRDNLSYREIHGICGASLTTIGRVARTLNYARNNGYKAALAKVQNVKTKVNN